MTSTSSWFFRPFLWCLLFGLHGLFGVCHANTKDCSAFFRAGKLKKAGECFRQQADAMGESSTLPPMTRYRKGRLMLNAARIFSLAAKKEQNKDKKEALYTMALVLYRRYLAENLFEGEVRQAEVAAELKKVEEAIPKQTPSLPAPPPDTRPLPTYRKTRLTILTGDAKAEICVAQENDARRCRVGASWRVRLSPGPYLLRVQYPGSAPQTRLFTLRKGQQATYAFSPPQGETPVEFVAQDQAALLKIDGGALFESIQKRGKRWLLKLPPGRYSVRVSYPGAVTYQRNFEVFQGKEMTVRCERPSARLTLTSTPSGAHIFVDDLYSGKTPSTLAIPKGTFTLKLKHPCYRMVERQVLVFAKSKQSFPFFLERETKTQDWMQKQKRGRVHPAVVWTSFFGGLALVAVGGIGYGVGAAMHQNASRQRRLYENAQTGMEVYATAYEADARAGNSWITIGHLSTFLGITAMGVGTFLFVQERPDVPTVNPCDTTSSPSPKKPN